MRAEQPVELPLSKSVALRVLTLNAVALASGCVPAQVRHLPDCEDVEGMLRGIGVYRSQIERLVGCCCRLTDTPAVELDFERVDIGQGGAPLRFFMALAASTPGVRIILDCHDSLKKRPHSKLVKLLRDAGADIKGEGADCSLPPYRISGRRLCNPHIVTTSDTSSQYLSALMLVSALWRGNLDITIIGEGVSMPYLDMSAHLLRRYGKEVNGDHHEIKIINAGTPLDPPASITIPEDWSAISYFYELASITGRFVDLKRLTPPSESLQGDSRVADFFALMGVHTVCMPDGSGRIEPASPPRFPQEISLNLNDTPDLAPALAVAACMAGVHFRFEGVAHLRHKETDRMEALIAQLRKLGYLLTPGADTLLWSGERIAPDPHPVIATYHDHRMAMAFAPAACKYPGLRISMPEVVAKSFPGYWSELERAGFELRWE